MSSTIFMICQSHREDLSDEERRIVKEMGFEHVSFESGSGVYKNKNDAIAVAKKLIDNNPLRNPLTVVSAQRNNKWN